MIVVTMENFKEVINKLLKEKFLSNDQETTGLFPYKKDRLFAIQFSDEVEDYYFNFQKYSTGEAVLDFSVIKELQPIFQGRTIFMQNAKFDMAFLYKEGIRFDGCDIHDTEVAGRIIRNDHLKYSLDEQAKRELGEEKDDRVMEYLKKNKLFTSETIPGKDTVFKSYQFNRVPFEIIAPYGCKDTNLTRKLGMKQISQLKEMSANAHPGTKTVWDVHVLEKRLIHTCFHIERVGVKIDREYCDEAIRFESDRIEKAERLFADKTGIQLIDSGQCLGPVFEALGYQPGRTETGEYEITDAFLETVSDPLGGIIQEFRNARKRANTYFKSYIYFADSSGVIHANMKQAGTRTGRFSYMDPNLQNIPSDDTDSESVDDSPYPIRRAFIPREGYFLLSIDLRQVEFRMMLDEAGQHDLINKIKEGHDPHTATAELTGLSRKAAKTLNFGLLYGMGLDKLALALGITREEAAQFKRKYFAALPMVEHFIVSCSGAVKSRHASDPGNGYIRTWDGRRGYFDDPKWAYRAANFKIQGGSAGLIKIAMNSIDDFLKDKKSRMLITIHDELVFELHESEFSIVSELKRLMCKAYPHRHLPMDCSVEYSKKSLGDLNEMPT